MISSRSLRLNISKSNPLLTDIMTTTEILTETQEKTKDLEREEETHRDHQVGVTERETRRAMKREGTAEVLAHQVAAAIVEERGAIVIEEGTIKTTREETLQEGKNLGQRRVF